MDVFRIELEKMIKQENENNVSCFNFKNYSNVARDKGEDM